MQKYIVITGASKGIGHAAADALVEHGWSVLGAARTEPCNFPGQFLEVDLADESKTEALATSWPLTAAYWAS